MPANLPVDNNANAIQTLGLTGSASNGAVTDVSSRVPVPLGSNIIRLCSTVNCFVSFGDAAVTATSSGHLFPAGIEYFSVLPGVTHVAALRLGTTSGNFGVSRAE